MPETPTKAGFYWYTPLVGAEVLVEILPGLLARGVGATALIPVEALGGEFGERIPSSATLAALRELAAKDPLIDDDWGGGFPFCHYCGGVECGDGPDPDVPPYRIHHHADCPYPKAQEKRDE